MLQSMKPPELSDGMASNHPEDTYDEQLIRQKYMSREFLDRLWREECSVAAQATTTQRSVAVQNYLNEHGLLYDDEDEGRDSDDDSDADSEDAKEALFDDTRQVEFLVSLGVTSRRYAESLLRLGAEIREQLEHHRSSSSSASLPLISLSRDAEEEARVSLDELADKFQSATTILDDLPHNYKAYERWSISYPKVPSPSYFDYYSKPPTQSFQLQPPPKLGLQRNIVIYGHPSALPFETTKDFAQHVIWLYKDGPHTTKQDCKCSLCRKDVARYRVGDVVYIKALGCVLTRDIVKNLQEAGIHLWPAEVVHIDRFGMYHLKMIFFPYSAWSCAFKSGCVHKVAIASQRHLAGFGCGAAAIGKPVDEFRNDALCIYLRKRYELVVSHLKESETRVAMRPRNSLPHTNEESGTLHYDSIRIHNESVFINDLVYVKWNEAQGAVLHISAITYNTKWEMHGDVYCHDNNVYKLNETDVSLCCSLVICRFTAGVVISDHCQFPKPAKASARNHTLGNYSGPPREQVDVAIALMMEELEAYRVETLERSPKLLECDDDSGGAKDTTTTTTTKAQPTNTSEWRAKRRKMNEVDKLMAQQKQYVDAAPSSLFRRPSAFQDVSLLFSSAEEDGDDVVDKLDEIKAEKDLIKAQEEIHIETESDEGDRVELGKKSRRGRPRRITTTKRRHYS